jgi:hypothetical protein
MLYLKKVKGLIGLLPKVGYSVIRREAQGEPDG